MCDKQDKVLHACNLDSGLFLLSMTKKLPFELKQKRKHIQRACVFCNEKHLQCDVGRPCQNCLKRNVGYLCRDKVRKTRKHSGTDGISKLDRNHTENSLKTTSFIVPVAPVYSSDSKDKHALSKKIDDFPTEIPRVQSLNTLLNCAQTSFLDPIVPSLDLTSNIQPDDRLDAKQSKGLGDMPQLDFDSMWMSNEYMKLDDLTRMYSQDRDEDIKVGDDKTEKVPPPPKRSLSSQLFQYMNVGPTISKSDSRPFISLEMATASSVNEGKKNSESASSFIDYSDVTPYRLRQLIKTPQDLSEKKSLIKPHNYRAAYKQLLKCLYNMFLAGYSQDTGMLSEQNEEAKQALRDKIHLRREQLRYIATSIVHLYMPTFVTLTSNMIEDDLLLQEVILQRTLLEYESMAKLVNCTPICIWRRSGEICFVSNEFLSLTGFSRKAILDNRKYIIEFLDHQSVVDYYDLFHQMLAFGSGGKRKNATSSGDAVFSECKLLVNNGFFLKCSCCWSVKRDSFNIPLLIMGQFLPIFDSD